VTINRMPTLEELRRVGGTAWILKLFVEAEGKAEGAQSGSICERQLELTFLSPSQEDLSTLAKSPQKRCDSTCSRRYLGFPFRRLKMVGKGRSIALFLVVQRANVWYRIVS